MRQTDARKQHHADNDSDRQRMTERDGRQRAEHRGALLLLQAERHREQPTHAWIDAVKRAQSEQNHPWRKISHRRSEIRLEGGTRASLIRAVTG